MLVRSLGILGLATYLATAFTPLATLLSRWLDLDARLAPAAAIVVLGGGGVRGDGSLTDVSLRRTMHGIRLHQQGLAPLLVLSGPAAGSGHVEAEARAEVARACGVAPRLIVTASRGRTTREEAGEIGALLAAREARDVILVADRQGMRRAAALFERAGLAVAPAPADDVATFGGSPDSQLALMRRVLQEAAAWLYYRAAGHL